MNIHIQNIGECQKCGLIISSLFNSKQGKKYNISLNDTPEECDLLIIAGCLARTQLKPLKNFWSNMPKDHRILLFGNCGTENQDLFSFPEEQKLKNQAILKEDLTEILPIDFNLEGCPPTLNDLTELINTFF